MNEIIELGAVPIKCWTGDMTIEDSAQAQLVNVARLSVVWPHVAVMPDIHWGMGATVGSVIPTRAAIIPAAVGVDIGCGMMALKTSLRAEALDGKRPAIRAAIERNHPERLDLTREVSDLSFISKDRAAYNFWNGFANALMHNGFTRDEVMHILQSKHTRWMLDTYDDEIETLGYVLATKYTLNREAGNKAEMRRMCDQIAAEAKR